MVATHHLLFLGVLLGCLVYTSRAFLFGIQPRDSQDWPSSNLATSKRFDGPMDDTFDDAFADEGLEYAKRGMRYVPVAFKCKRNTAVCRNGGRGPKTRRMGNTWLCVCMCPPNKRKPQCR